MKTLRIACFLLIAPMLYGNAATHAPEMPVPETFRNPILPGFHPDPSICRVGEDYYLVNSSFEWFPAIPVYHSRDLVNWKLIGYGLHRPEQIALPEGMQDSHGLWAATIRHHDGLFYLTATCYKNGGNFYITAENPAGPWSDPVWLDIPGIDPSLMWDDDGKCYYTGNGRPQSDPKWKGLRTIWAQELDLEQKKLVGERVELSRGHANNSVWAEGPHIYKIDGKYLLLYAEGGTGRNHATVVEHSDSVLGPYRVDQINPVLTHRHLGEDYPVHSVGHTDMVQTQNGDWWAVTLARRNIDGYSILARETFLCPVRFEGDTPIFNAGVGRLPTEDTRPDLPWAPFPAKPVRDEFDSDRLDLEWNMLRTPQSEWYRLKNGMLTLQLTPNVLSELTNPSLLARRIEHLQFTACTKLRFSTEQPNEKAGMILYRSSQCHYQFLKTKDRLVLIKTVTGKETEVARVTFVGDEVVLKAKADRLHLQFFYGKSEESLKPIGTTQSMSVLSWETAEGFSGPYVGMYATGSDEASTATASFDWFEYRGE